MDNYSASFEIMKSTLKLFFLGRFGGDLCNKLDPEINREIASALDKTEVGKLSIIFDLSNVEYVSSLFLRTVIKSAKKVGKGKFSIIGANPFVAKIIQSSGLDMLISDPSDQLDKKVIQSPKFMPSAEFAAVSSLGSYSDYAARYSRSISDPEGFFGEEAEKTLFWRKKWNRVLEWNTPDAKWFVGAKLNASENCLDRHLDKYGDKTAILWEGEPLNTSGNPEIRKISYRELHAEVCRFANGLKFLGFGKGDRAIIYMPMLPEAVVAMLACARLGIIHSVIFGGFSAQAIADRAADCQASFIITADGGNRRGEIVQLKKNVDDALGIKSADSAELLCRDVRNVIVLKRTSQPLTMHADRDIWWHELISEMPSLCEAEEMDADDALFILYTSGSTGKPKGIYHATAGYMLGTSMTHRYYFDIKDNDIFWCTADIGWITGHSYVVYGPLANASTVLIYEGAPNFPDKDRFWSIIERHRATILYTAPTAIRSFMQWGEQYPKMHDLSSLRLLGSVGEPINPQAWKWYSEYIGGNKCPIVDTWWQTETGSILISTFPGAMATKPGAAGMPFFGVKPTVLNDQFMESAPDEGGRLFVEKPWPSICRGIWGDRTRFIGTYWSEAPGLYFTGDGARKDSENYFWIVGRIDDVLKVSGHRIGTAEIESALVAHPSVAEAAVVGRPDDMKEFVIVAFVTLKQGIHPDNNLKEELKKRVVTDMGAIARPEEIRFTQMLPKTRSGKIMRRLLKQVAAGAEEISGDVTTLEDFNVIAKLMSDEQ
jgi:acetyl-CoA synthetase